MCINAEFCCNCYNDTIESIIITDPAAFTNKTSHFQPKIKKLQLPNSPDGSEKPALSTSRVRGCGLVTDSRTFGRYETVALPLPIKNYKKL